MKSHLSLLLFSAAAVSSLAFAKTPPDQAAADHKIEILERDIATSRARTEEVAAELAETRTVLESTVKYLTEQSANAKNMSKTLDDSETAGFTWGINPDSRHILLKGWRDELAAMQKDLPALPATKTGAKEVKDAKDSKEAKLPGSR